MLPWHLHNFVACIITNPMRVDAQISRKLAWSVRKHVMTSCKVGTRIFKYLKFWSWQNLAKGSWTMRKLFVNSSWQCVPVHVSARHALGTSQVWFSSKFCSAFDLPCGVLSTDYHTAQTRAFCSNIPWYPLSFVSFFEVELSYLNSSSASYSRFCCSSSMARALPGIGIIYSL